MPYFSVLPGNGEGESVSNQPVFIGCMEEYGYDAKVCRDELNPLQTMIKISE